LLQGQIRKVKASSSANNQPQSTIQQLSLKSVSFLG